MKIQRNGENLGEGQRGYARRIFFREFLIDIAKKILPLDFKGSTKIIKIEGLEQLQQLTELRINFNEIRKIEGLGRVINSAK